MAYPWVKLWTEFIHDPKIGRLPEHLQLVFVKLMCVTGEHDARRSGELPPIDEMSWTLRMADGDLLADLESLARTGMVRHEGGVWYVTNFETRQGPMSAVARKGEQRNRDHKGDYYGAQGVTNNDDSCHDCVTNRDTDKTRLDVDKIRLDVDVDAGAPAGAPETTTTTTTIDPVAAQFYQGLTRIGALVTSRGQADAYNEIIADIRSVADPPAFINQLMAEAAATTSGRVTPRWFEAVVDRCIREGRMPGDKRSNGKGRDAPSNAPVEHTIDEWAAVAREYEQK